MRMQAFLQRNPEAKYRISGPVHATLQLSAAVTVYLQLVVG